MEHHKGHEDEIVAIVAHELGHGKLHHMKYMMLINVLYVVIFALIMIPLIDREPFLAAFGFNHENYFILLFLYAHLYYYTLDIPWRFFINYISRVFEFDADEFSVHLKFGE